MRKYEMMVVYDVDESTAEEVNATVKEAFTANDIKTIDEKDMGPKGLAYEINNKRKGHYFLYHFETEQNSITELRRSFKLNGKILRYLITKQDK